MHDSVGTTQEASRPMERTMRTAVMQLQSLDSELSPTDEAIVPFPAQGTIHLERILTKTIHS